MIKVVKKIWNKYFLKEKEIKPASTDMYKEWLTEDNENSIMEKNKNFRKQKEEDSYWDKVIQLAVNKEFGKYIAYKDMGGYIVDIPRSQFLEVYTIYDEDSAKYKDTNWLDIVLDKYKEKVKEYENLKK